MNINDVYVTQIYTVISKSYKMRNNTIKYNSKYNRTTLVKKEDEHFYDLVKDKSVNSSVIDSNVGDEFVAQEQFFEPITNYIDYDISSSDISKEKVLKLVKERGSV